MMIDGVENRIEAGVNTALDMVEVLDAAGQPLIAAIATSRILRMEVVRESLAKYLAYKSGSVITHTSATTPAQSRPVPAQHTAQTNQHQTVD
ncbi:hypothetical protein [Pseudomonas aeruginosa]|uniref:hypothetical protein n=1 Tax=Pseudomonas aeruginosa TaxID=287 RepID=UPI001E288C89|nr:hypothetical protein [Pseudomonas aeruginosa]MCC9289428.1 hypothetical protein [Pseudomonas aeruginosa]UVN18693.1 Hypothetical protein [Pseudomonas aeruginosa]